MRITMWRFGLVVISALVLNGQQPADAGLDRFGWLAGHWLEQASGDRSEEIWSPPAGDSMMGMWRLVKAGSVRILEFMTIAKTDAGVELFLRHFDRSLTPRETEKEHPSRLTLLSQQEWQMVFEGTETTGRVRLSYRRKDDTLTVVLEKGTHKEEFRFHKEPN